jgi:hypothetical protein
VLFIDEGARFKMAATDIISFGGLSKERPEKRRKKNEKFLSEASHQAFPVFVFSSSFVLTVHRSNRKLNEHTNEKGGQQKVPDVKWGTYLR